MITVLVTDRYDATAIANLKLNRDFNVLYSQSRNPSSEELAEAQALLIRSRTTVDAKLLEQAPQLKIVLSATAGFDHIDWKACANSKVAAGHTPEAHAPSVAEHTFLLMVGALRNQNRMWDSIRKGNWKDGIPLSRSLHGKTLGIIGMGRIGKQVTAIAKAYGMKVVGYDPYIPTSAWDGLHAECVGLIELFKHADIVTLHVPLTKKTRHMINIKTLEEFASDSVLINTCRGEVVREQDLIDALESKRLAAAGLDVFEYEPLPKESRLRKLENVIMTPHCASMTEECFAAASHQAVDALRDFFNLGTLSCPLPTQENWFLESL